jgi:hypothetical protein
MPLRFCVIQSAELATDNAGDRVHAERRASMERAG